MQNSQELTKQTDANTCLVFIPFFPRRKAIMADKSHCSEYQSKMIVTLTRVQEFLEYISN